MPLAVYKDHLSAGASWIKRRKELSHYSKNNPLDLSMASGLCAFAHDPQILIIVSEADKYFGCRTKRMKPVWH